MRPLTALSGHLADSPRTLGAWDTAAPGAAPGHLPRPSACPARGSRSPRTVTRIDLLRRLSSPAAGAVSTTSPAGLGGRHMLTSMGAEPEQFQAQMFLGIDEASVLYMARQRGVRAADQLASQGTEFAAGWLDGATIGLLFDTRVHQRR